MKLTGIDIEHFSETYPKRIEGYKGRIKFNSERGDWVSLKLTESDVNQIMQVVIPIFEKISDEKIDFLKKEFQQITTPK